MNTNNLFYTYLWLREDGTPYYVGKGKAERGFISRKHRVSCPDKERIVIQEWPCEKDAFEAEKFLIEYYGRMDIGTGCLRNLTEGGEGASGHVASLLTRSKMSKSRMGNTNTLGFHHSEETRLKMSLSKRGRKLNQETKDKIRTLKIGKPRPKSVGLAVARANRNRKLLYAQASIGHS